jgi:hypothetical protein
MKTKNPLTDFTSKFFVQPTEWGEFDSSWADEVSTVEEGLTLCHQSKGTPTPLTLWELCWRTGKPVKV